MPFVRFVYMHTTHVSALLHARWRYGSLVLIGLIVGIVGPQASTARSLHWPAVEVSLRIDDDGLLHITERHSMLFDGDWNGGERRFQTRSWQGLQLHSISELVPDSVERIRMQEGDLDSVNEYRLDGNTLRWRARLPTDAPFQNEIKHYEIVYTISGALLAVEEPNVFRLDHDLAFPDRDGVIEEFSATIELAPEWHANDLPRTIERANLPPGQSVFIATTLGYAGAGTPGAVADLPNVPSSSSHPALRYALTFIVIMALSLLFVDWLRSERARGRFAPTLSPDDIDETWLSQHVFAMRPELVGAAWDRDTSAAEVAALIARLVQEGKLSSEVTRRGWGPFKRDTLHLTLKQPRERFESYERQLIAGLFVKDSNSIDTDVLREHYKAKGFDPSGLIEAPIARKLPGVFKTRSPHPAWRKWTTATLLIAGIVLSIFAWIQAPSESLPGVLVFAPLILLYVIGIILAFAYQGSTHHLRRKAARALVLPFAIETGLLVLLVGGVVPMTALQLIGVTLLGLAALSSLMNAMHGRDSPEGLELRRKLGSAREYFERELASQNPKLRDEWFPYLLAFGLGPRIDRWFRSFGHPAASHSGVMTTSNPGSGSSRSSPGWTGGGGAFGGAGASASWTSAVSSVAAGVAKPSSSGGSGGGGGGGSSGGGGGGGW